jgi:hypothetical protein
VEEHEKHASRRLRWAGSIFVLVAASLILTIGLQVASFLGAKKFVEGVSDNTAEALKELKPYEMATRFKETYVRQIFGECLSVTGPAFNRCMQHHPMPSGPGVAFAILHAMGSLIWVTVTESPTHAVVDLMQLIAGFAAMIAFMAWTKGLPYMGTYPVLLSVVPLWLLFTCLLSFPLLFVLHFAAKVMGEVLPQAGVATYGGFWTALVYGSSSRAVEGGLHHKIDRLVEHTIGRLLEPK